MFGFHAGALRGGLPDRRGTGGHGRDLREGRRRSARHPPGARDSDRAPGEPARFLELFAWRLSLVVRWGGHERRIENTSVLVEARSEIARSGRRGQQADLTRSLGPEQGRRLGFADELGSCSGSRGSEHHRSLEAPAPLAAPERARYHVA
jgi:hypothetical protein